MTLIAPQLLKETISTSSFAHLGKSQEYFFFTGLNPNEQESREIKALSEQADLLIFCAYNDETSPAQQTLIQELSKKNKNLIVLSLRNPSNAAKYEGAASLINTFSPTLPSIEASYKVILNGGALINPSSPEN